MQGYVSKLTSSELETKHHESYRKENRDLPWRRPRADASNCDHRHPHDRPGHRALLARLKTEERQDQCGRTHSEDNEGEWEKEPSRG